MNDEEENYNNEEFIEILTALGLTGTQEPSAKGLKLLGKV